MIRLLLVTPVFLIVLFFASLYTAYGQVDPCRVLAVERARRAEKSAQVPIGAPLEAWTRLQTSQMSSGSCMSGLLDSWGARLSESI
jgi:hypothetical protein